MSEKTAPNRNWSGFCRLELSLRMSFVMLFKEGGFRNVSRFLVIEHLGLGLFAQRELLYSFAARVYIPHYPQRAWEWVHLGG